METADYVAAAVASIQLREKGTTLVAVPKAGEGAVPAAMNSLRNGAAAEVAYPDTDTNVENTSADTDLIPVKSEGCATEAGYTKATNSSSESDPTLDDRSVAPRGAAPEVKAAESIHGEAAGSGTGPGRKKDEDYIPEEAFSAPGAPVPADASILQQPDFNVPDGAQLASVLLQGTMADVLQGQNAPFVALEEPYGFETTPEDAFIPIPMDASMPLPPQLDLSPHIPENVAGHLAQQLYMNPSLIGHEELEEDNGPPISAYAKLVFADGNYFMNTPSLDIGRDQKAYRAVLRREKRGAQAEAQGVQEPNTPVRSRRGSRYSKSVVSETGGILRQDNESDNEDRERRRRIRKSNRKSSKRSGSTESSSHPGSRGNYERQPDQLFHYQAQLPKTRSADVTVGSDPVSLQPASEGCPILYIHPADPAGAPHSGAYKAISRKHLHIGFNAEKHFFEATFLGKNGGFAADVFRPKGDIVPLHNGIKLQVAGVLMEFLLPDNIPKGETGAEQMSDGGMTPNYSEGGKAMSFDFDNHKRAGAGTDTSEESSEDVENGRDQDEDGSSGEESGSPADHEEEFDIEDVGVDEDDNDAAEVEDELEGVNYTVRNNLITTIKNEGDYTSQVQKKRGPGRPPKDGIMSKREKREVMKAAKAAAALEEQSQDTMKTVPSQSATSGKNKVGRPRKHPKPDTSEAPREKRKYTKRKPKEPKEGETKTEGSGDDQPTKEKKEKKSPKPPRSPSPTFNEEDLTPEQLAKPQANYVTLIHEALSNSETKQMSLPQIYRAIQRKYPYFVLKCGTNGWQSSVRHNLGQHPAFQKIERDGKGWMWGIVPGASIEKERKKRPSPPPYTANHNHHPIHPNYHMMAHPYAPPGMIPPPHGYPLNYQAPPNFQHGQAAHYMPLQQGMNGNSMPPHRQPLANSHQPPPYPAVIPPQLAASSNRPVPYSSPYAPKPAPPTSTKETKQASSADQKEPPSSQPAPESVAPQESRPNLQESKSSQPYLTDAHSIQVIEKFKAGLREPLEKMTGSAEKAEAILTSAANRVLGYEEQNSSIDSNENMIIEHMRRTLANAQVSNTENIPGSYASGKSIDLLPSQGPPQPLADQDGIKANASQQATQIDELEKPSPVVPRPSFARPNGNPMPRPSVTASTMKRTDSTSSANAVARPGAPTSASPAPISMADITSETNTLSTAVYETGQNENGSQILLKRERSQDDNTDDMRSLKKIATSGPPSIKI